MMDQRTTSVRKNEIDILKSVGIILMIMGHQMYGLVFDQWIHAFHMPMFFLISGFLYKKPNNIRLSIKRKVQSLLIPYLFFGIVHLAVSCILALRKGSPFWKYLKQYIYHLFVYNHEGLPICGAIWFLTAMFFLNLMYIIIDRVSNEFVKVFVIAVLSGTGVLVPILGFRLPLSFDVSMMSLTLYYVGHKLSEFVSTKERIISPWVGILLFILSSGIVFLNNSVNVRLATYGNIALFYLTSILLTVALYVIVFPLRKKSSFVCKELSFIGANSIVYLGLNQIILAVLKKNSIQNPILNAAYKLISLFFCLGVLHICTYVIMKTKMRVLVGKRD